MKYLIIFEALNWYGIIFGIYYYVTAPLKVEITTLACFRLVIGK